MRVLPADLKTEVESLIDKEAMTMDLYEILGQCTWGQKDAAAEADPPKEAAVEAVPVAAPSEEVVEAPVEA